MGDRFIALLGALAIDVTLLGTFVGTTVFAGWF